MKLIYKLGWWPRCRRQVSDSFIVSARGRQDRTARELRSVIYGLNARRPRHCEHFRNRDNAFFTPGPEFTRPTSPRRFVHLFTCISRPAIRFTTVTRPFLVPDRRRHGDRNSGRARSVYPVETKIADGDFAYTQTPADSVSVLKYVRFAEPRFRRSACFVGTKKRTKILHNDNFVLVSFVLYFNSITHWFYVYVLFYNYNSVFVLEQISLIWILF